MICARCADAADRRAPHDRCPGETWCDCQHMSGRRPHGTDTAQGDGTEPEDTEDTA